MRLSAQNFDINIGGHLVMVESMSVSITDNTQVAMTRGVTNGYTVGSCEASVSLELDSDQFEIIIKAAKSAGSFQDLEPFDISCFGSAMKREQHLEVFGVKLKVTDLFSIDTTSADKTKHSLEGFITSPDFIRIDGVPYLSKTTTRDF
ncbi:phage protein [Ferrimonas senticii]|uniref:phage protein n=1 Tax=Ferrimonas senticii TaxID=394566 RepID=UPI00041C8156|nr:phage protein [Ferrimonas senticii]